MENNKYIVINMEWLDAQFDIANEVIEANDKKLIEQSDVVFNTLIKVLENSSPITSFEREAFKAGWEAAKDNKFSSRVKAYFNFKENRNGK